MRALLQSLALRQDQPRRSLFGLQDLEHSSGRQGCWGRRPLQRRGAFKRNSRSDATSNPRDIQSTTSSRHQPTGLPRYRFRRGNFPASDSPHNTQYGRRVNRIRSRAESRFCTSGSGSFTHRDRHTWTRGNAAAALFPLKPCLRFMTAIPIHSGIHDIRVRATMRKNDGQRCSKPNRNQRGMPQTAERGRLNGIHGENRPRMHAIASTTLALRADPTAAPERYPGTLRHPRAAPRSRSERSQSARS